MGDSIGIPGRDLMFLYVKLTGSDQIYKDRAKICNSVHQGKSFSVAFGSVTDGVSRIAVSPAHHVDGLPLPNT